MTEATGAQEKYAEADAGRHRPYNLMPYNYYGTFTFKTHLGLRFGLNCHMVYFII